MGIGVEIWVELGLEIGVLRLSGDWRLKRQTRGEHLADSTR
jgi:hypothetical protein